MNRHLTDFKSVGKKRKTAKFKISKFAQRRNPIYKLKLENPVPCLLCEEKQQNSAGHKKTWRSLNSLHGHLSYDHYNQEFKTWLESLAEKIIIGEMK